MNISIDISMYPLREDFENIIIEFIKRLRNSPFKMEENGLSTQIHGPYSEVMDIASDRILGWLVIKVDSSPADPHEYIPCACKFGIHQDVGVEYIPVESDTSIDIRSKDVDMMQIVGHSRRKKSYL